MLGCLAARFFPRQLGPSLDEELAALEVEPSCFFVVKTMETPVFNGKKTMVSKKFQWFPVSIFPWLTKLRRNKNCGCFWLSVESRSHDPLIDGLF